MRVHCLNIGRDVQRLDIGEAAELVVLAPGEEAADRMQIGRTGVLVADSGGEEFQEAARGLVAGGRDNTGHQDAVAGRDSQGLGRRNLDILLHAD